MKKLAKLVVSLFIVFSAVGCAKIDVTSSPSGAEVFRWNPAYTTWVTYGKTPTDIGCVSGDVVPIKVVLDGYKTEKLRARAGQSVHVDLEKE